MQSLETIQPQDVTDQDSLKQSRSPRHAMIKEEWILGWKEAQENREKHATAKAVK